LKAILLAAGYGTRLRPLTNATPKCLVKIKNKPLLQLWLESLTKAGVNSFLINTHYLHVEVENFIHSSVFKNKCKLVYEEQLLGTAGTLIKNINFIENDEILLIHADNYCLEDINNLILAHKNRPNYCLLTMMTFRTQEPSSCGIVEVNESNIMYGFHEKISNPPGNLANCAVYILSKEFINILRNDFFNVNDFSKDVLAHFVNKTFIYETKNIFIDIGTIENYNKANK
jgi:mannose-1-phosphate guanylyltransferase